MIKAITAYLDDHGWKVDSSIDHTDPVIFINPETNKRWTINFNGRPISQLRYMDYPLGLRKEDLLLGLIPYLLQDNYKEENLYKVLEKKFLDYGWKPVLGERGGLYEIHPKEGEKETIVLYGYGEIQDNIKYPIRTLANVRERAIWKVLLEILEEWTDKRD